MPISLKQVAQRLGQTDPELVSKVDVPRHSAVALVLRELSGGLDVLMIKRAEREGDPWSGHMAFPGGHKDQGDDHSYAAVSRETWEEVGLDLEQHGRFLGRLSDRRIDIKSRDMLMVVSPYIFAIDSAPELNLNHEVAEVHWIPLRFFADTANRQTMHYTFDQKRLKLPCYFFAERRIWGLSLGMLDELLERLLVSN